ncbi:MAG: hypothetical protein K6G51_04590 [Sphaerochaetaceae bacterium]|nr:hypothetical protein [Sphaerochaetaceae bacterium]
MNNEEKNLPWTKIIAIGIIPIILIYLGFYIFIKGLGIEKYMVIVNYINEHFGLFGIFLYVFLVDLLILPLSPDLIFPVVASMKPLDVIPVIGAASVLGGWCAYFIGYQLSNIRYIRDLCDKAMGKWGDYIKKYGVLFVVLSGLLPLPFSTITMAVGAFRLDMKKVLPACLVRFVRMAAYFYLFNLGFKLL